LSIIDDDIKENNLKSLRARIFHQLQNDIINGKYKNGDSLIETRLSNELGVSRTPVREAITQLELEGLVKFIPNKGAIVNGITKKDIEDIFTIRILVEGLAGKWASRNILNDELSKLKEICDLQEFYTNRNDVSHMLKIDTEFHELIFKVSKSMPLIYILKTFHHYIKKARELSLSSQSRASEVLLEHINIYKAIASKDEEKSEKLMSEHIKNAYLNYMKVKKI
jgi:DNA-binding GntR family transcriptional regulator